jgi:hypothetical protein
MSEIVFQITEDDTDGALIARALGHSIVTAADNWEQLRTNVRQAVLCHFDEGKAPAVIASRWNRYCNNSALHDAAGRRSVDEQS